MASSSNFIFSLEIHLQNIEVTVQFQGHGSKVKVTRTKKRQQATQKLLVVNRWDLIEIYVTTMLEVIRAFDILTFELDKFSEFKL